MLSAKRLPLFLVLGLLICAAIRMEGQSKVQSGSTQTSNLGSAMASAAQNKAEPDDVELPVRKVPDPGAITTNQAISPAGVQSVFESRVYGIAFGATSSEVYAATTSKAGAILYRMDWTSNRVLDKLRNSGTPGMQSVTYDADSNSVLMTAISKAGVELIGSRNFGSWNAEIGTPRQILGRHEVGGVAISPRGAHGTRYAVVALTFDDEAAILDLSHGTVLSKVKTGIAPFGVVIDATNTTAYVTNWGGRFPTGTDQTSTTGSFPGADRIAIDSRGIAASGTVSKIDLKTGTVTAEIEVGLHPTGLALDAKRNRLYVANSNSDTVSVVDVLENKVVDTIAIEPFAREVAGIAPEALALSKDGDRLYVACAGINAVAVLALKGGRMKVDGLIPTGWYPDAIALSPDEKYLGVSTLLGVGSGWKNAPIDPTGKNWPRVRSPANRYVHSYRGTIHVIEVPGKLQLQRYSSAVAENNHLPLKARDAATEVARHSSEVLPVPLRAGDPSPIQHILYIIKENRSYDQFFGDLGKGNGDPSLEIYSEDVIPNQRKLARDYVLLDNFYATGGNSADGHQWVTQANETDYTYWPGYGGRSYPYDGDDPMADAYGGFIWNQTANAKKSFEDFGEYAGEGMNGANPAPRQKESRAQLLDEFKSGSWFEGKFSAAAPIAALNPYLAKDFPAWTLDVPDAARARILIRHLRQWEAKDKMPDLVMAQLPSDHTGGTTPGFSTPRACIADNDYAIGLVVEAFTHSKFWKSTLILIVEDDAQAGVDHVDGHRTVALAVSPYIKRGSVDSTFYSQPSMLKTIELILGLKNMSLFDLIANDMRNSFQTTPDLTPYAALVPEYSIYTLNPPLAALSGQARQDAQASLRMNFKVPDAAPTERLNRILWRDVKGDYVPYPKVAQAVFAPYSNDLDDDEKDRRAGER
jgi:YVTN family beta-propeller protein